MINLCSFKIKTPSVLSNEEEVLSWVTGWGISPAGLLNERGEVG